MNSKLSKTINMIGHILKLVYKILEGKIESKRNQGQSRASFVKQMIFNAGLSS
jgi:hypothetical protein